MPPQESSSPTLSADDFSSPSDQAVVIVDPYSTGCLVAQEAQKRGYSIMALWTYGFSPVMKTHVPMACGPMHYVAEFDVPSNTSTLADIAESIASMVAPKTIVAVMPGGEAGVDLADALSEQMKLRTNGTDIPNRRDKKVQQELIRKVGLRSVRQASGTVIEEVMPFLQTEPFPIVLKPTESAGSDGVKLCHDIEEAKEHFNVLMKSQMVNGGECPAVLCQEFLKGKEYVVDCVSRDGVHKTAMCYVYDKRPANGSQFVYFGDVPIQADTPEAKIIIPYIHGVLDALGFRNGASHGEVMITDEGPCLVEMNCRAHGGDGLWRGLCKALTGGYSQVEMTVDAYLDPEQFQRTPSIYPKFKASGQEVIFVSFSAGKVKSTPGYDVIKNLPSFYVLETGVKPGSEVDYTVDLLTGIGSVILMHPDEAVVRRDIDFIRYLEEINGFFVYETKLENLKRPRGDAITLDAISEDSGSFHGHHRRVFSSDGPMLFRHMSNDRPELRGPLMKRMTTVDASKEVVVVVDPYSTGCVVAQEILKRGFRLIALWTRGFSPEMKTHVPLSVTNLKYFAEVEEADNLADTVTLIYQAAGALRVVACIAGGEAGVDAADAISERLAVRTNGTNIPNKRDKKIQQELIKKRGLRSVRQACGAKFEEVEPFLKKEAYPLVLKPVESAGSDGVKLCHNYEEAKEHFELLMKSQMVNGGDCPAVLCQEFLRGKEYVVDTVSRDGVHKVMMCWVYDKRPANGSQFVYFGCVPVDSQSPEAKILIPYIKRVLDALDIKNGPAHGEVMLSNDGPCLVEMNCRPHGGDGCWAPLARALTGGYSQVESTVDSYLDLQQFKVTPEKPPSPFKAYGQEIILVSFSRGKVKATPGFDEIKKLQSYVYLETGVRPGSYVDHTVDLFTGIGSVVLVHHDKEVFDKDVQFIRDMEKQNKLFEYEPSHSMFLRSSLPTLPDATLSSSNRQDMY